MKNHRRTLVLILCTFLCTGLLYAQHDWIFKNEKEGVKVYYRKTSDVYELKLVTSLKTSLSGILTLLGEVENYPKWGYKVAEAKFLNQISDTEMYYYSRFDFPWPLDDRDVIMHSTMEQDPVSRKVVARSKAMPKYLADKKGVVRMQDVQTSWTLIPGPGGWVYIEYFIHSHPGGSLPDWLINSALEVGPRETIKGIRDYVQQPHYQVAKLAHIKD
jgi:START domain